MKRAITVQTSCRADLAGGTLDIWPLYLFHPGGVTVNYALKVFTRCRIEPRAGRSVVLRSDDTGVEDRFASVDALLKAKRYNHGLAGHLCRFFLQEDDRPRGGFTLTTDSESPAGAGISGSSAMMVAATYALAKYCGRSLGKEKLREIAQSIETRLIRVPTGCQDYYPALYGGVGAVHLSDAGVYHERLAVAAKEMEERFLIVYTGTQRQSGINNWEVFKAHIGGDRNVIRNFESISQIAQAMRGALLAQDWEQVARLIREEWKLRRTNAPGISTLRIERIMKAVLQQGAVAAKVCGAGGGGCIVIQTEPGAMEQVIQAAESSGGRVLTRGVAAHGARIGEGR